jgi:hypothetical protein
LSLTVSSLAYVSLSNWQQWSDSSLQTLCGQEM